MTDLNTIAENYITAWNESDAVRRQTLLKAAFTEDVSYRDPIMQGDGHDGVDALIEGVQQRFAGFRFSLKGKPDGFGDTIRFSW
ncbi:MAG: nuclear transport factor 2 family protein, partial [Mesorhizobium sp.]